MATFPVVVESRGRYVFRTLSRNVGTSGLLVMMSVKLEVDEPVVVTYTAPGSEHPETLDVEGRIVRIEQNTGEDRLEWPFLAAVELKGPGAKLDLLLADRRYDEFGHSGGSGRSSSGEGSSRR